MLKPVLTANWRYLAFLNFAVDPQLLATRVPAGTEIDFHKGVTFLSVVGFLSADTVLLDQPALCQRLFEDVQLRFPVRQRNLDDWRRGVVIVREILPRIIAPVFTHAFPGERFVALGTRHDLVDQDRDAAVEYAWRQTGKWQRLSMTALGESRAVSIDSEEDFIVTRPWRYTALASRVVEYRIEHPRWAIRPAASWKLDAEIFGPEFSDTLRGQPHSAFIADGSHVRVSVRE